MDPETKENMEYIQKYATEVIDHLVPLNGGMWVKITVEYGDYSRKNITELQYVNSYDSSGFVIGICDSVKTITKKEV